MSARLDTTAAFKDKLRRACRMGISRLLVLAALLCWSTPADAKRVALVIGNTAYDALDPLANPSSDARLIAQSLLLAGFDRVDLRTDLDRRDMRNALAGFAAVAADADVALIYYAGHGVESSGRNWFIPVDARLKSETDLPGQAVPMEEVLAALKRAKGLKVLIVDACRNNRFAQRWSERETEAARRRLTLPGLGKAESGDSLVFYSAKAGTPALDGGGGNSLFALALAGSIAKPLEIRRLFGVVREDVLRSTGGAQEPFTYGTGPGDAAYLAEPNTAAVLLDADEVAWGQAQSASSESGYGAYLQLFPRGRHWADAAALRGGQRAARLRRPPTETGGSVFRVYADRSGDFPTLADAVRAARDGDRIVMGPGDYRTSTVELTKSLRITGPESGPSAIIRGPSDVKAGRHVFVVSGGTSRIEGLSIRCACDGFFVFNGSLTLRGIDLVVEPSTELFAPSGVEVTDGGFVAVLDSRITGKGSALSGPGELLAVGNDLRLPISLWGDAGDVFLDNDISGGDDLLSFSGWGWVLVQDNRIDARGSEAWVSSRRLFYFRRTTGQIAIRRNTLQAPQGFKDENWIQCVETVTCDVALSENTIVTDRTGALQPRRNKRSPP